MTSSQRTARLNLPTILTLSRIAAVPLFLYITPGSNFLGAMVFAVASITDFFDGYLARKYGEITKFGQIADPIADKFLIITALISIYQMGRVSLFLISVIIAREVLVTGLRFVALGRGIVIPAERGGKWKVGAQITAVLCLLLGGQVHDVITIDALIWLLGEYFHTDVLVAGTIAMWISMVLALTSGVQYTINFVRTGARGGGGDGA